MGHPRANTFRVFLRDGSGVAITSQSVGKLRHGRLSNALSKAKPELQRGKVSGTEGTGMPLSAENTRMLFSSTKKEQAHKMVSQARSFL